MILISIWNQSYALAIYESSPAYAFIIITTELAAKKDHIVEQIPFLLSW